MDTQTASMTYISGMKRGASDSGIDRLVPLPAKAVKILTSSSNFADRYSSSYGIGDLSGYPYVDYIREEEVSVGNDLCPFTHDGVVSAALS